MTALPTRHVLQERLGRLLLPTYGARANAADSLLDLQQTRLARAQALDALARSGPSAPAGRGAATRATQ